MIAEIYGLTLFRICTHNRCRHILPCSLGPMSEMEMKNDVETEEFTDELCDEALDREDDTKLLCAVTSCRAHTAN